jgi:Tfp pilus assembly protein PilV
MKRTSVLNSVKIGFTLIEIMLSLLVVTIGIVAVIGLLGTSLDSSAKAHSDLNAVSFSDMVFNYYHAVTNWNEIPPDGSARVPDYAGNTLDLSAGTFTCMASGIRNTAVETYTVSYTFSARQRGQNVKELSLHVWPGLGNTNDQTRARFFYTEIYNWADK